MAKTLYVIDNPVMKGFSQPMLDALKKEITDIFKFAPLKITWVASNGLPEKIDFTDSVVMVVPHDDDVESTKGDAEQQQVRSINDQIQKSPYNGRIRLAAVTRAPAKPDQGGVGWQNKQVLPAGSNKVALCQTGGIASCQTPKETILAFFAPDKLTLDEAKDRRLNRRKFAAVAEGGNQKRIEDDADAEYAKSEQHWKLRTTLFTSWPKNIQEAFGQALARLMAHEVRHQYIVEHHDPGGLGGEAAEIYGVARSERFLPDDEKNISAKLVVLEADQKTSTDQIKTFPNNQAFAVRGYRSAAASIA